jgi:hypothetical protein
VLRPCRYRASLTSLRAEEARLSAIFDESRRVGGGAAAEEEVTARCNGRG